MNDFRPEFYKDYVEFKEWDSESGIDPSEMFELEFQKFGTHGPLRILEIGFGKGELLDWAREKGHHITGIEIIPQLVELAKSRGHNAIQLSAQDLNKAPFSIHEFDVIVILDVLEHLYIPEIIDLLKSCHRFLRPQGQILTRFPNGLSPFGLVQHMKDITHITILSPDRMEQLGRVTGFKVKSFNNAARSLSQGNKPRWVRVILYRLRNLIETAIGLFYYGNRVPLDPNMSLILQKHDVKNGK